MGVEELGHEVQGLMVVMASVSHGLENILGRGAAPITFKAGRAIGLRANVRRTTTDLMEALTLVQGEFANVGILWPFEPWKPASSSSLVYTKENGTKGLKLVFRNCMVRCALFRYGHEQRQSLCMMNHGLFCGYLQKVMGKRADLDIVHAGESACLKELTVAE
jgi:hypothetical protein